MQGIELISVPPVLKFVICAVIFAALLVVYWWQPDKKKKEKNIEKSNCVELDPQTMAGPTKLLDPSLEDKQRSTQHVTLELLDDYAKELKKQHIRSFDEV